MAGFFLIRDIFTNFVTIMIIQPHPKLILRHIIFYDCSKIVTDNAKN